MKKKIAINIDAKGKDKEACIKEVEKAFKEVRRGIINDDLSGGGIHSPYEENPNNYEYNFTIETNK
jgi:hypothetical protein